MSFAKEVEGFINAWNLVDSMQRDNRRLDQYDRQLSLSEKLQEQQQENWNRRFELDTRTEDRLDRSTNSDIDQREWERQTDAYKLGLPVNQAADWATRQGLDVTGARESVPGGAPTAIPMPDAEPPPTGLSGNIGGDRLVNTGPRADAAPRTRSVSERSVLSTLPEEYRKIVEAVAPEYGLDPELVARVMRQESRSFNPEDRSGKGAAGLMGLMPKTAKSLGVTDVTDPLQNIEAGTRYLAAALQRYDGDLPKALAAYNWGQGNLAKHGLDNAPLETRNYIRDVTEGYGPASAAPAEGDVPAPRTRSASAPTGAIPSDAAENIDFTPLLGGQPITAYGVEIAPEIIDRTSMKGLKPITLSMLDGMARRAQAAGVKRIVITAGHGPGHRSHGSGTEIDVIGYGDGGRKWSIAQRNEVARGAADGGADRFGLYEGRSLHIGKSYKDHPASVWGNKNVVSNSDAKRKKLPPGIQRAFKHPDNVAFLKDFNSGKLFSGGGGSSRMVGGAGGTADGSGGILPVEDNDAPMDIRSDTQKEAMGDGASDVVVRDNITDENTAAVSAVTELADDAIRGGGGTPAGGGQTKYPMFYSPDEMGVIMRGIDNTFPNLSPEQRTLKGLAMTWQYYINNPTEENKGKADRMASSILAYSELLSAQIGQQVEQAAKNGNVEAVAALMKKYHQTMPDGRDMEIEPNGDGTYSIQFTDTETGAPATPVQVVTGDDLLAEAFGLKDGPSFDKFLRNGLGARDMRGEDAFDEAMQDLKAIEAEVKATNTGMVRPDMGGEGVGGRPGRTTKQGAGLETLMNSPPPATPDYGKMRFMSDIDQKAYLAELGRVNMKAGRIPSSGADLTPSQTKEKIKAATGSADNLNGLVDDYLQGAMTAGGVSAEQIATETAGKDYSIERNMIASAAEQIIGMNDRVSVADAIAIATEMLQFDTDNPDRVFFRAKANSDGTYSVQTDSGKVANMSFPTFWNLASRRDAMERGVQPTQADMVTGYKGRLDEIRQGEVNAATERLIEGVRVPPEGPQGQIGSGAPPKWEPAGGAIPEPVSPNAPPVNQTQRRQPGIPSAAGNRRTVPTGRSGGIPAASGNPRSQPAPARSVPTPEEIDVRAEQQRKLLRAQYPSISDLELDRIVERWRQGILQTYGYIEPSAGIPAN